MESIRVLQVVTIMNRGGLETMLMNYYRQMDRTNIQFDFLVHREERGHYDDEIESMGGAIYRMPRIRPGAYRTYFHSLDRFFREHPEYAVVHSHINENSSFVLASARRAGVPCRIAHSHLSDLGIDWKLPFRMYARIRMKDHPNQYFACSRHAGRWLFGSAKPVTVLQNAVDVREFRFRPEARRRIREELGAGERFVIGHVGRFNKQKNHEFLLDIFRAVLDRKPDALLVMAGDGTLRAAAEKKAKALGLSDSVRFLGVRDDIPALMQGMDYFLFPSLFEGLPVVLVEAQAAGLRCAAADTITRETDVTNRVDFISLKEPPEAWADRILHSDFERTDTSELLAARGYDTATTAQWLSDFYMSHASAAEGARLGRLGS